MESHDPFHQQRRRPQHEQLAGDANELQPLQEERAAAAGRMQHPGSAGGGISSITQRLLGGLGGTTTTTTNNNNDNLLQANLYAMAQLEPTPIASHHVHSMTNVVSRFGVQDDQNLLSMDQNMQFSDSLRQLLPTSSMSFQPQAQPTMFRSGDDAVGGTLSGSVQGHVEALGQFGARVDTATVLQLPPQNIMQHPSAITIHQPFLSLDETIGVGATAGVTTNSSNANTSGQQHQQHRHHNLFVEEGRGAGTLTKIDHPMLLESILSSNPRSNRISSSATTGIGQGRRSSSSDRGGEMKQVSPPLKRKLYVDPSATTSESKRSSTSPTTTHNLEGQRRTASSASTRRSSRARRKLNDIEHDATSAGVAAATAVAASVAAASSAPTPTRAARARPKGISTTSSPQRFRSYQNEQWNMKFQELCEYRRQHGNCNVPSSYDRGLSKWVKRQRYQYKLKHKKPVETPATSGGDEDASTTTTTTSTLTDERQEALERIGFVWHSHESAWEERYEELCTFHNANGHCNVPTLYPENTALPLWLQSQRRQYRLFMKGERSFMTEERIAKLSSIGFIFTPRGAGGATTTRQSSVSSSSSTT